MGGKNSRISIKIASDLVTPKAVSQYSGLTLHPVFFFFLKKEQRERVFCGEGVSGAYALRKVISY